jgi:hypothetical protein
MFFRFPPDARWNTVRSVVELGISIGNYEGVVRVSRRVFQILLPEAPTPERCLEAYHLHRTRLEIIAERKVRRKQLTEDGNVEIDEEAWPPFPRDSRTVMGMPLAIHPGAQSDFTPRNLPAKQ